MTKIYLVRGSRTNLVILETELIKQTPEQLRIDPKTVKLIWKDSNNHYFIAFLSSRLQRSREHYFTDLDAAIAYASEVVQRDLETAHQVVHNSQLQLASLAMLSYAQKEPTDAD